MGDMTNHINLAQVEASGNIFIIKTIEAKIFMKLLEKLRIGSDRVNHNGKGR